MNLPETANPDLSARPHVLMVDDDARIRDLVSRYLHEHGFIVVTASDAAEARALLKTFEFDAMVVDVMMPGETGLEFTRDLRGTSQVPVLLLTALGEAADRITGFESGADDYLPKPFEPRELVLRLQSILRRAGSKRDHTKLLKVGRWIYNAEMEELQDGDEIQKLTAAESKLMKALAAKPREVISREDLAQQCGLEGGERTIDVQVTRLRRKIEADTKTPRFLLTVRGKGYMLRAEEA